MLILLGFALYQWLGIFYALEGGANIVWWYLHPPIDPVNATMEKVWEGGRLTRTIGGIVLILLAYL
jgi:hypothetical protein